MFSLRTARYSVTGILGLAMMASAPVYAFRISAALVRDDIGPSGPSQLACTFCVDQSTHVSADFSGGFPPPAIPVVPPGTPVNSEISGNVHVDLATGTIRGNAHAASFGHMEFHSMGFGGLINETIDITVPPGLPPEERFVTFIGQVHASASATGVARSGATYSLDIQGLRAAAAMTNTGGWTVIDGDGEPNITITRTSGGFRFVMKRVIPTGGEITIESQLGGTAEARGRIAEGVGIADVNAGDTAVLSMILPAGASYTSTSGVFLTSPVPEPHTWKMTLAGIALLLGLQLTRMRRSAASTEAS